MLRWLVDAGKLPGNVRSVGNGFGYESKIVIFKAVVGFVKFRDETLLRGRGCNIPNFLQGFYRNLWHEFRNGPKRAKTISGRDLGVRATRFGKYIKQ